MILVTALSHTSKEFVLLLTFVAFCSNTLLYLPLALAAPAGVSVQAMSANSIKVSWTPAPTASNVSVTYHINVSSSTYQTVRRTETDPDHELVISGLHPFAEYYITVQTGNPGGLSKPTGRHVTTLTAGAYCYNCSKVVVNYFNLLKLILLNLK